MTRRFSVLLLAPFLLATACDDRVAMSVNEVVSGTVDDTDQYPEVVFVGQGCSGTLISPSHVLTAAHCVASAGGTHGLLPVTFAPTASGGEGTVMTTSGCWMRPEYAVLNHRVLLSSLVGTDVGERCAVLTSGGDDQESAVQQVTAAGADMAILLLSEPVGHPVAGVELRHIGARSPAVMPARWLGDDGIATTWSGSSALAVGFGADCFDVLGSTGCGGFPSSGEGTRRSALTDVTAVATSRLIWWADAVLGPQDSGGPLFDNESSARRVVGVANQTGTPSQWAALGNEAARTWIASHLHATDPVRWDTNCPTGFHSDPTADATNDADGDWVLDAVDTCPGVFNPCQLDAMLADADRDGVADDCDACPADHALTMRYGESPDDDDHDGVPNSCDCQTGTANFADTDHDYIRDDCDNCGRMGTIHVANTNQADCDGDHLGDRCSLDSDHDGTPDTCDNCRTRNRDQANCNEDAERRALGCNAIGPCVGLIGDICDPTPCPYAREDLRAATLQLPDAPSQARYMVPDLLRMNGVVGGPNVRAPTDYRFCACPGLPDADTEDAQRSARSDCARLSGCVVARAVVGVGGSPAHDLFDPGESAALQWRHMTFDPANTFGPAPEYFDARPGATRPPAGASESRRWGLWEQAIRPSCSAHGTQSDCRADLCFWDGASCTPAPDVSRWQPIFGGGPINPSAPAFPGVLWSNATPAVLNRELRSHYESGGYALQFFLAFPPASVLQHGGYLPTPDCILGSGLGRGGLGCLGTSAWLSMDHSVIFTESGAFTPGSAFPSAPSFSATDLQWTHVAEPIELLAPNATLRYVAASPDGVRIASVLHLTQYGYTPQGWHPACPGGPNCPPPECDPTSDPGKCLAYQAPPGDPLFVLSASRGELFVVAHDVQAVDMSSGQRRAIDLGEVTIGPTLHTATYDVVQDRLYVIDELLVDDHGHHHGDRDDRHRHEARLLSIDPAGGAQVVASWPRSGATTRFALGAAEDALYLASSGEHGRHTLVSIRVEHHAAVWHRPAWDEVITRGIGTGDGIVASVTTYASRYAVTFVIERDGHAEVARYEPRQPSFHTGDCMGDVF